MGQRMPEFSETPRPGGAVTRPERRVLIRRWAPHVGAGILLLLVLAWDGPIYTAIQSVRTPFLDTLTERVSHLRGATFPITIGALLVTWGLLRSRTRIWRGGVALLLAVAVSGAIVSVLKPTFARPRPEHDVLTSEPGASWIAARYGRFPSSHAAILFASATALAAFLPMTAPVGYALAVLVCYERLYRGTHSPSDIVAGAWIGIVTANLIVGWLARRESWRNDLSRRRLRRRRIDAAGARGDLAAAGELEAVD